MYGRCDGIDPVEAPLVLARTRYPGLLFTQGTPRDVHQSATFQPYDAVIASEVIEHVIDKDAFVTDLACCVMENGHAVLTTPRLELRRWLPFEPGQPIEAWLSERDLRALFLRNGFSPIQHDRVDVDMGSRHPLDRLCNSRYGSRWMDRIGLAWMKKGFEYVTGIYQVWWFQKATSYLPNSQNVSPSIGRNGLNGSSSTGLRCAAPTETSSSSLF